MTNLTTELDQPQDSGSAPNGEATEDAGTTKDVARKQIAALIAQAAVAAEAGWLKYATLEQLSNFIESGPALVNEATKMLAVRARQSESGKTSGSRARQ